ncbi:hypothetical protein R3P38DRAFT_3439752 [Favolaschia claudopus]|uniref:Uncharacterized protein n=1 Tax=Favolaschia claudopus TaxID=2862362 RepID=A0AAV9ZR68_9AGAR
MSRAFLVVSVERHRGPDFAIFSPGVAFVDYPRHVYGKIFKSCVLRSSPTSTGRCTTTTKSSRRGASPRRALCADCDHDIPHGLPPPETRVPDASYASLVFDLGHYCRAVDGQDYCSKLLARGMLDTSCPRRSMTVQWCLWRESGSRYVRGVTLSSLDFVEIRGVKGTGSFPQQVCPNRSSQQLQLQYYGYTNKNQFYSSVPKYSSTSMRFRKASNVASVSAAVGSFGGKSIISVGMGRRLLMLMLRRAHLHRQRQHLLDLSQIYVRHAAFPRVREKSNAREPVQTNATTDGGAALRVSTAAFASGLKSAAVRVGWREAGAKSAPGLGVVRIGVRGANNKKGAPHESLPAALVTISSEEQDRARALGTTVGSSSDMVKMSVLSLTPRSKASAMTEVGIFRHEHRYR